MLDASLLHALLDRWPVGRLATVRPGGAPHVVPVVFARSGAALWVPVDGKRKRHARLARFDNVAAEPRASLLLDRYDADWQRLWWLRLDGTAARVQPDARDSDAILHALTAKYPQYADPALAPDPAAGLLRFEWSTVSGWAQGDLAETIAAAIGDA